MIYPIIKNPEYVDLEKTTVKLTLVDEKGTESVAEFKVPENKTRGVNVLWDRVMDEFDIEKMRRERNNKEVRQIQEREFQEKKKKAAIESEKLRLLFETKMKVFNLPFIAQASDKDKAAVRRAPDITMLNIITAYLAQKYIADKQITFLDLLDEIDDMVDQQTKK